MTKIKLLSDLACSHPLTIMSLLLLIFNLIGNDAPSTILGVFIVSAVFATERDRETVRELTAKSILEAFTETEKCRPSPE